MNILTDRLPTTVEIDGKAHEVNSDFRTVIRLEQLMLNEQMDESEKLTQMLFLFYKKIDFPLYALEQALEGIVFFYRCGQESNSNEKQRVQRGAPIYSFEHDAPYIYAAFLSQYGVDLTQVTDLHWWQFKAMFDSLSDTTQFIRIVGYRSMVITRDMSPQQKEFYERMKRVYALPLPKIKTEELNALEQALLNGGDLKGLL